MTQTLTATYRITTPMFCSGADPSKAELRLTSFKGALRFWWRTLMWAHVRRAEELRKREGEVFGSTDHGRAKARIRLRRVELPKPMMIGDVFEKGDLKGAYYLGYGVMEAFGSAKKGTQAGQLIRPAIPGGIFEVQFLLHPKLSQDQVDQLRRALILLGTVGGLGSKARKGFGSLTLTQLEGEGAGNLPADVEGRLRMCLPRPLPEEQPEWTAWSAGSRVVTATDENQRAVVLLDELGREQVHYRSWGRNGKVLGQDREGNFSDDHDLSKGKKVSIHHPKRIAFGLPHNYGKGDANEVKPASTNLDRRASPLFLHVHRVAEEDPVVAVVAFLPSRFLPGDERIRAFGRDVPLDEHHSLWQPVHGYLDRLIEKTGATAKTTNLKAREVPL